ncbi:MAG: patatin-like phospholipase family protein [Hahellaceae bacterium]|nr:patatin-like phospholipase family protein [Hahellaceae bacterium]
MLRTLAYLIHTVSLAIFAIAPLVGQAEDVKSEYTPPHRIAYPDRPKIGLVLGGGGAKGAAHVGVLRVLEELKIPVDIVVGTSAGSAVGAMYAMGKSASDIETTFFNTDWEKGFIDSTPRPDLSIRRKQDQRQFAIDIDLGYNKGFRIPQGIVQGQRLQILLNEMTLEAATVEDFDHMPIRYRAVATDLETGQEVVLRKGNLAQAIRASMSVPGVYTPVEIDGKTLVDGGLANNVPVSVARALGADVIIAVDLTTPLRQSEELTSSLAVLEQLSDFMTGFNSEEQVRSLGPYDIYIRPEFGDIGSASFDRVSETIEIGAKTARSQSDKLAKLSIDQGTFEQYQEYRQTALAKAPKVDRVRLVNNSALYDEILLARISQKPGKILDTDQLEQDLGRVYGLGYFETVTYRVLSEDDGSKTLVIEAKEKSWGPNYIRFGIEMQDNFKGASEYALTSSILATGINRYGAEWVNTVKVGTSPAFSSEFYQPLGYAADYFSRTFFSIERTSVGVFVDGRSFAEYEVQDRRIGTEGGLQLSTDADFALGVFAGKGSAELQVGPPETPDFKFDLGAYYARFYYDRLDDEFFPSSGQLVTLLYTANREDLGSETNFDRVEFNGISAHKWDNMFLNLRLKSSQLTRNAAGSLDNVQMGGFLNLSGYVNGEVLGEEGNLAVLQAYYQMSHSFRWYLGASAEMGNAFYRNESQGLSNYKTSGSVYVAANTFMGPIALAYGYAKADKQAIYLNIGKTF